jgi:hypothetical protein
MRRGARDYGHRMSMRSGHPTTVALRYRHSPTQQCGLSDHEVARGTVWPDGTKPLAVRGALPTSIELIYPTDETAEARLLTDQLDFWENAFVCPARHRHPRTALRVGPNRRRSSALMRTASPRPVGSSEALSDRAGASQVRGTPKAPQNDDNQRQGSALGRSNIQPCDQVSRDRRTRPRRTRWYRTYVREDKGGA